MKALITMTAGLSLALMSTGVMAQTAPKEVDVPLGKTADISLDANPSTGYSWMVKRLPESLVLAGSEYHSNDNEDGAVGTGGKYVYTVIGQQRGTAELQLIYGRSFDKSSWETKTVKVNVK